MDAFLAGLEQAEANGHDLAPIGSVASFFVSRNDTETDNRLDKLGSEEAKALRGTAAIANARLAYQHYEQVFAGISSSQVVLVTGEADNTFTQFDDARTDHEALY